MSNPNANILADMSCPKCGSHGPFEIAVLVTARVSDDESAIPPQDHDWDDASPMQCLEPDCEFTGQVINFHEEGRTPTAGPMVTVTFRPQAWQNDYAVPTDPEGPTTWEVPAERLRGIDPHTYDADELRHEALAPAWVREWSGPFEIDWDIDAVQEATE